MLPSDCVSSGKVEVHSAGSLGDGGEQSSCQLCLDEENAQESSGCVKPLIFLELFLTAIYSSSL